MLTEQEMAAEIARAMQMTPPEMVEEFHRTFGHPVDRTPKLPSKEEMLLRCALIEEEYKELYQACAEGDFIEAADALGDLLYVILGAIETFGLANPIGGNVLASIHASNMSKACDSVEEAQAFLDEATTEEGCPYYYNQAEGSSKIAIYYADGPKKGKVVKGPNYFKPDLSFLKLYTHDAKTKEV